MVKFYVHKIFRMCFCGFGWSHLRYGFRTSTHKHYVSLDLGIMHVFDRRYLMKNTQRSTMIQHKFNRLRQALIFIAILLDDLSFQPPSICFVEDQVPVSCSDQSGRGRTVISLNQSAEIGKFLCRI